MVQLDAQARSRKTKIARFDESNTNEGWFAGGQHEPECGRNSRQRCKTKTENEAMKGVCVTRIQEVDGVEHERSEEQRKQEEQKVLGERKIARKQDPQ